MVSPSRRLCNRPVMRALKGWKADCSREWSAATAPRFSRSRGAGLARAQAQSRDKPVGSFAGCGARGSSPNGSARTSRSRWSVADLIHGVHLGGGARRLARSCAAVGGSDPRMFAYFGVHADRPAPQRAAARRRYRGVRRDRQLGGARCRGASPGDPGGVGRRSVEQGFRGYSSKSIEARWRASAPGTRPRDRDSSRRAHQPN